LQDIRMDCRDLMVFFNVLHHHHDSSFKISSVFLNLDLFEVNLNRELITCIVKKNEYKEKRNEVLLKIKKSEIPHQNMLSNFIPPFDHFRTSLIAAGAWKPKGWDDLIKTLNQLKSRDPLKGERPVSIGFDTNCFINRIHSNIELEIKEYSSRFSFILSKVALSELRPSKKIHGRNINVFKSIMPEHTNFISEFWNQDTLDDRRRSIGLREFHKIRKNTTSLMDDRLKVMDNSKDLQIIEELQRQASGLNHDLIFITSDKQFLRHARGSGITGIEIGIPPLNEMPSTFKVTWLQLCEFLYVLSIYEGILGLHANNTYYMQGIWRGKSTEEWDESTIKIRTKGEKITKAIEKQLKILKKIK